MQQKNNSRSNRFWRSLLLGATFCSALSLLLSPPVRSTEADESWYQVEMIIFANVAGRWQQSEHWRDQFNLIYPNDLAILRPFKAFEFGEFDTDFDHLRKSSDTDRIPNADVISAPPAADAPGEVSVESGDAAVDVSAPIGLNSDGPNSVGPGSTDITDIEAAIAAELASDTDDLNQGEIGFSQFPQLGINPPQEARTNARAAEPQPMDLAKDPFLLLPAEDLQLKDSARRIRNAFDMRLISHIGWRQPANERGEAMPVLIQGGDQFGLDFELEGLATLSKNRFLHVDVNLFLSQFQRSLIDSTSPWASFGASSGATSAIASTQSNASFGFGGSLDANSTQFNSSLNGNLFGDIADERDAFERVFTAQSRSTRRVRSGELHYIDHPLLGILVHVTPYTLPDPVMEMRDFDLDLPQKKPVPFFIAPANSNGSTAAN